MKKKIISLCFSLSVLLSIPTFAQGPGEPYFPETANGAHNAFFQNQSLRWQNPIGVTYNEVYISYDSSKVADMDPSSLYVSGYPGTAFDSIRINLQLYHYTRYFWCVVEYNSNGFTRGDVWHFTTDGINTDFYLADDFSFGLGKWNINNAGGCGWQIGESVNYTLPIPSISKLLRADKNLCGNIINATATFQQVNIMKYMWFARLELNSDWKTENQNDVAKVEMSTNNGSMWTTIWEKIGISDRNKHIELILFTDNGNPDTIYTMLFRFKTIQYGIESWWVIDNIVISTQTPLLSHFHPWIINVNANYSSQPKVILKFGCSIPSDVRVERKTGLPLDPSNYQILASYYSTYINTFTDSTIVDSSIYTYRVGVRELWPDDPWYVYGNEATGYVFPPIPVELMSFVAEVFLNDIKLEWSTATETNNSGFETERTSPIPSPYQGEGVPTSRDGRGWETIGFVPGFGTSTEVHHYAFTDESLQSGNYQYRLKQIDFDGTFEYSNIIEVSVDAPTIFSLEQNYPNPFNPTTKIKYSIAGVIANEVKQSQFVTLKIYDILGNEVATLVNEEKPAGTYEVEFNVAQVSRPEIASGISARGGYASGIYFYQLKAGSFIETKKMVLLK